MPIHKPLYGKRFGRLLVEKFAGYSKWHCVCDCGNVCVVDGNKLKIGHTTSCGCRQIERAKKVNTTHGQGGIRSGRITRTYRSWQSMKARCYNENHDAYPYYGERGVTICERWLHSFESFYEDMGDRPPGHTIDRIDNAGNYEPSNCRWASDTLQKNNRSGVYEITVEGVTMNASQAAIHYGVNRRTIARWIHSGRLSGRQQ